jgi:uncharacterized membrane protein YbhN (UPF0104 family)
MDRLQVVLRRVAAFLDRLSARTESPRGRQISMVVSAVLFVVAMVLGFRGLPEGEHHLVWWAIVVTSVIGVPVLIALNGVEYVASGAVLGHRIPMRDAMPIAVYARAANLLPLPGAALVRMQGLKREGSSYGRAASATLSTALFWLGASLLVGGLVLVPVRPLFGLLFFGGGVFFTLLGHVAVRSIVARREDDPPAREALRRSAVLLGVELAMVGVRGVRFWLVMIGFDIGGSFAGAMLLPVAGVVSSAIGFFPSGLGIREVLSGALSRMVGDTASSGLLASGLDRLVSLPVMAVVALVVAVTGRRPPTDGTEDQRQPASEPA